MYVSTTNEYVLANGSGLSYGSENALLCQRLCSISGSKVRHDNCSWQAVCTAIKEVIKCSYRKGGILQYVLS